MPQMTPRWRHHRRALLRKIRARSPAVMTSKGVKYHQQILWRNFLIISDPLWCLKSWATYHKRNVKLPSFYSTLLLAFPLCVSFMLSSNVRWCLEVSPSQIQDLTPRTASVCTFDKSSKLCNRDPPAAPGWAFNTPFAIGIGLLLGWCYFQWLAIKLQSCPLIILDVS